MSLTDFLVIPDVRENFRREFPKPRMQADKAVLAPPQSQRYSLVGTAFDYLLRFYLQRLNPKAVQRIWVADAGLKLLVERVPAVYDIDTGRLSVDRSIQVGRRAFDNARTAYADYIASGQVTDRLLRGAIHLAQLDVVYRSGWVDENLGVAHREDVQDLRALLTCVNPDNFRAKRSCLLNPTFGDASRLVGGADADVVIDSMLIDVKTTKRLELDRAQFNQLVGYLILSDVAGFGGVRRKRKIRITKLAIYFARHAHLEVFNVKDVVNPKTYPAFAQWFSTKAESWSQCHKNRSAD